MLRVRRSIHRFIILPGLDVPRVVVLHAQVHCTEALCYAVDVDKRRIVSFDPRRSGGGTDDEVVATTTVVQYDRTFAGVYEDASALDRDNLVSDCRVLGWHKVTSSAKHVP
jgi:hypothetical protein